ncbi:MBL fold metallo-hydrolase [Candidatus Uhrbacteria bacterium]|jgi:competence protein ComEC|nr:MBL fold metallo-hydrolase [Candidatus Uhrbacteria bacterium]
MDTKRIVKVFLGIVVVGVVALAPWLDGGRMPWVDGCVVWVFDVGQGDGIFMDCPYGQVLIDGGPSGSIVEDLTRVMPFWDRSIDLVVNTHPHADHLNGLLPVLERYDVGEVWTPGQTYSSQASSLFDEWSFEAMRAVEIGDSIVLGEEIELSVVFPEEAYDGERLEDPNDGSVVTLLTVSDRTMLFTGDAGVEQEAIFQNLLQEVDILKVGHHGSLTSSGLSFLESINPELAIISLGENGYGHPHPVILDRFERLGIPVMRTDLDGSIRIDLF